MEEQAERHDDDIAGRSPRRGRRIGGRRAGRAEPSVARDHKRRDHGADLSAGREGRLLSIDALRLVRRDREPEYKGHNTTATGSRRSPTSTISAMTGPNDDVISAEFTAMVGPAEEFGAIGYNEAKPGGLFVKPASASSAAPTTCPTTIRSRTRLPMAGSGTSSAARRDRVQAHPERAGHRLRLRLHQSHPLTRASRR